MLVKERIEAFDQLLRDTNPEASDSALVRARNAFIRKYGGYAVAHEIALAVAMEHELLGLRNAGKKCQEIYANAQVNARAIYGNPIQDVLDMKSAMYAATDKKDWYIAGIDRMVLQCIERGIRSKESYDICMPLILAYSGAWEWDGDRKVLGKTYELITKQMHTNTKDPHAYIVRYVDDGREIVYTGVDPLVGRKKLVDKLTNEGFNVNVSGRINGLPIHFINAETKEEEPHGND